MATSPSCQDPKGVVEKLRAGEVPLEALGWIVIGHSELLRETEDKLRRIEAGHSPHVFQFIEGPPGSGKSALLHLLRDVAEGRGFASCSIEVTSKGGQFTEQAYLVAHILRSLRVHSTSGVGDLDSVLKEFSKRILTAFPKQEDEPVDREYERLRRFLADRMEHYAIPEKSVLDAAYGYIFSYRAKDPVRMRRIVEWLHGENLTIAETRNIVGAETKLDERTALPILRSIISILQESGHPGLVLLVDEMVQSMKEHHESQRQRTAELVRSLYSGAIPRSLIFVGATPETITDSERGLAAHPGMKSRVGDGAVPDRDADLPRYRVGYLSPKEAAEVFDRIRAVYIDAYGLPDGWCERGATGSVNNFLPNRQVIARDFVSSAVRLLDSIRKQRTRVPAP